MTIKRYFISLFIAILVIYGAHFLMLHNRVISYSWYHFNVFDIAVFMVYLFGGLMFSPAFKETGEKYVGRFLVLTTFQMLAVLALVLAVVYTKVPNSRMLVFNVIGVFLSMLAVQSVLLVSGLKRTEKAE